MSSANKDPRRSKIYGDVVLESVNQEIRQTEILLSDAMVERATAKFNLRVAVATMFAVAVVVVAGSLSALFTSLNIVGYVVWVSILLVLGVTSLRSLRSVVAKLESAYAKADDAFETAEDTLERARAKLRFVIAKRKENSL